MANEKLIVELSAQIQGLKAGLDNASKEIGKFNTNTNKATKSIDKDFNSIGASANQLGSVLAGAFSIGALVSFGKSVVSTTGKFETMAAVLTNTLGSASQAQLAMSMITDFAAKTPFSVEELTGAFVKLANQGFKPSYDEMRKLGDLASSTGKSFGQLAEAILDAQTGEFERLKEFGIKAAVAGNQVTFAFKGVSTTVKNTSASIQQYLLSLGDMEGVSGAMAAISKTLEGRISNLGDAWTTLMKNFGDANTGVLKSTVDLLGEVLTKINAITHGKNVSDELNKLRNPKAPEQKLSSGLHGELWAIAKAWEYFGQKIDKFDEAKLGKAYDDLNKAISATKTKQGLQDLIDKFIEIRSNLDQSSDYWLVYGKAAKTAQEAIKALTDEEKRLANQQRESSKEKKKLDKRIAFKLPSMDAQAAVEYDISSLYPAELVNSYTSEMNTLFAQEDKRFKATDEYFGKYQAIYIPTEEKQAEILAYQNNLLAAQAVLAGTLTSAFEQMFTTLINGGQNAFQAIFDALKSLMIKLAAALVVASILFILTGGLSAGGSSLGSIGEIAKGIGGLGFDPIALFQKKPATPYIAMPSASTGQGGYQVDIMGDKMRLLLDNQAIKNSRVV
jgi:hypothetical protein